jgi:hypothetical protein
MSEPQSYQPQSFPQQPYPPQQDLAVPQFPPVAMQYQAPGAPQYQPVAQQPSNGVAVGGMVTGIIGLVFGWVPIVGFILGAIAVILSGVGIRNANSKNATGRGMAVAGLVCGILAVIFGIFWIAVVGAAGAAVGV